ncbi:hypothetical protein I6E52_00875 [Salinibacterium sp. NG253]|uniref:hypothetical protein n=1 Tax=Salinibacterium sp. NG253 TaxID=2792039 RepID=UPI0018CC9021|nr:hypothetical protein [Salinibacterium sp. NG253]MBH0115397.1 hypothetical protein [Salinibacterium sp. NG253]
MSYLLLVLQSPLILATIAIVIFLFARRGRTAETVVPGRSAFMRSVAVTGSVAVLIVHLAVQFFPVLDLAQRYLLPNLNVDFTPEPWAYAWWRYPLPLIVAVVVLTIVTVRVTREPVVVEAPVLSMKPRGWTSFASRKELASAASVLGALVSVSLFAGVHSITDRFGLHTLVSGPRPIGVTDASWDEYGASTFYGWAYSVPVMILAVVLAAQVWWVLRTISVRPFASPESVTAETRERTRSASIVLRLFIATVLLPLGGALLLIGQTAMYPSVISVDSADYFVPLGYASFAGPIAVAGAVLQGAALLMLVAGIQGKRSRVSSPELVRS